MNIIIPPDATLLKSGGALIVAFSFARRSATRSRKAGPEQGHWH